LAVFLKGPGIRMAQSGKARMYEGWSNIFKSRELRVSWAVQVNEE